MKKINLFGVMLFLLMQVNAQWTASGTNIYNGNSGNVGIGIASPVAKFQVAGSFYLNRPISMQDGLSTIGIPSGSQIAIAPSDLSITNNAYIGLEFPTNTSFRIASEYDGHLGTGIYRDIEFGRYYGAAYVVIKDGGNVGIGTGSPGTNKLAVEGTIGARAVKVTLASPWPDYVFAPSYRLMPLKSLEKYINDNGHLPNVPDADEIKKQGLDLGMMNAELLKKVEELTLYIIELKKENEQIKMSLQELRKK